MVTTVKTTKEEIKAKQVGNNLIVVIDGKKHTKVCKTKKESDVIKNKILLFNKRNTKTLKGEILNLVDKTIKAKEEKTAKEKGLKKAIKKATKKIAKKSPKKVEDTKTLVEQVESEFHSGNFSDDEIKRLEDLLAKKKEEAKQAAAPVVTSTPRRGEY